jgi:hypothetical protein
MGDLRMRVRQLGSYQKTAGTGARSSRLVVNCRRNAIASVARAGGARDATAGPIVCNPTLIFGVLCAAAGGRELVGG